MNKRSPAAALTLALLLLLTTHLQAATRICSIYLTNINALQQDVAIGINSYQMPILGLLPALLTGNIPGSALIDNSKPLAFHIMKFGADDYNAVMEATTIGTPEALLQALLGDNQTAPTLEDGIYRLGPKTAVRFLDGRAFIVRDAANFRDALPPDITQLSQPPNIPGNLRLTVAPTALQPILDLQLAEQTETQATNRELLQNSIKYLSQIEALHIGLEIKQEGLFLRTRNAPKKGMELATLMANARSVTADQLALFQPNALLNTASGGYADNTDLSSLAPNLLQLLLTAQDGAKPLPLQQHLPIQLTANALSIALPDPQGPLCAIGSWQPTNAAALFNDTITLADNSPLTQLQRATALKPLKPTLSEANGARVATWPLEFDQPSLEKIVRDNLPKNTKPEELEATLKTKLDETRAALAIFKGFYSYALKGDTHYYSIGPEDALANHLKRAPEDTQPVAAAITAALAPTAPPLAIGSIALSKMIVALPFNLPALDAAVKQITPGGGIMFATWRAEDEILSNLLIAADELRALTAISMALNFNAGERHRRRDAPTRPPVPENF